MKPLIMMGLKATDSIPGIFQDFKAFLSLFFEGWGEEEEERAGLSKDSF